MFFNHQTHKVAPYTGAWIEMYVPSSPITASSVAPYTGAWIEILSFWYGLFTATVAPYTGAWIEIQYLELLKIGKTRRSLHGSVD